MNNLKYLGILLMLCGVGVFVAYSQMLNAPNSLLWVGLILELVGAAAYMLINKYVK